MSIISSEAERLYPPETVDYRGTLAQVYTSDDLQEAYMRGAERQITRAEIEAACRANFPSLFTSELSHEEEEAFFRLLSGNGHYPGEQFITTVINAILRKATEE